MSLKQYLQALSHDGAPADASNHAGGPAYRSSPRHRLAQYAHTGCLGATFYASADAQLADVLQACAEVDDAFIAKTAIHARERGYMKDMPVLLAAVLAVRGAAELEVVFSRVIDSGAMLRSFVIALRSGAFGRKSLGSRSKRLVQKWLNSASERKLLAACVGNAPSLADVLRLAHPKPDSAWRDAFFKWVVGRPLDVSLLPPMTQALIRFEPGSGEVPEVPFQLLTSKPLAAIDWAALAGQGGWHMVRMNLNTFARHGVFDLPGMTERIAAKLSEPDLIARAKVFPYQVLAAFRSAGDEVPSMVKSALQDALEHALRNVPAIPGSLLVCVDVSGSMNAPVSGYRGSASSAVRCVDIAALFAAAVLRKNPLAEVLPFAVDVLKGDLNPRDSVMTNAAKLAQYCGGGTRCAAPLAAANRQGKRADLVVYVSDNESWMDAGEGGRATSMMAEWERFKSRNPQARLVCLDCTPNATRQAVERADILNIGGFSDHVFDLITRFASGTLHAEHWVGEIEAVELGSVVEVSGGAGRAA